MIVAGPFKARFFFSEAAFLGSFTGTRKSGQGLFQKQIRECRTSTYPSVSRMQLIAVEVRESVVKAGRKGRRTRGKAIGG
jgi:hypothetical protein